MTITNKGDLSYPIFILNKSGDKINITDCNEFVAKFYTTDKNINSASSYIDNTYTNIDNNKCIINSSDLSLMGNGVLHYEYTYSIEDTSYEDNYYKVVDNIDTLLVFNNVEIVDNAISIKMNGITLNKRIVLNVVEIEEE